VRPTEAQRRQILDLFIDPIWASAPDHQIADRVGVTPSIVRELRADYRRQLGLAELVPKLQRIAERLDWPGSLGQLLEVAVERLDASARPNPHPCMQALRRAIREQRRLEALEREEVEAADAA
jgi:hypothetical protein